MKKLLALLLVLLAALVASLGINTAWSTIHKNNQEQVLEGRIDQVRALATQIPPDLPALLQALNDPYWRLRQMAAHSLGQLGKQATSTVPALAQAANEADSRVREAALLALGNMGENALPHINLRLADPHWKVRKAAVVAFGMLGSLAKPLMDSLVLELADLHAEVRTEARRVLMQLDSEWVKSQAVQKILPQLVASLFDGRHSLVEKIALMQTLARQHPNQLKLRSVMLPLLGALSSPGCYIQNGKTFYVHVIAAEALQKMNPNWRFDATVEESLPFLSLTICSEDNRTANLALQALNHIGPGAKSLVPYLVPLLVHSDPLVRCRAALAIGAIGVAAEGADMSLMLMLNDKIDYVSVSAIKALGKIGPQANAAIPALAQALVDNIHPENVAATLDAIEPRWRELPDVKQVVGKKLPVLLRNLSHVEDENARSILLRLGHLGSLAVAAVPVMVHFLCGRCNDLDEETVWALQQIDPHWRESASMNENIPWLMDALGQNDKNRRAKAISILSYLPQHSAKLLPYLVNFLAYPDDELRETAANAAANLEETASETAPLLCRIVHNTRYISSLSKAVARALVRVQPKEAYKILRGRCWPETANEYYLYARMCQQRGETRKAVELSTCVIEFLSSKDYYCHQLRADARWAQQETVGVIADCSNALEMISKEAYPKLGILSQLHYRRSLAYKSKGMLDEAEDDLSKAIACDPAYLSKIEK